ncbi:MAG: CopG family ribbon-helix-helix protein [Rhodospirillales bacterium]
MPVSVRLPAELNDQIASIAASLDRPKSWVIEQAVKDYVAVQAWHLAAIDEGVKAADAGRVVAHEQVVAWVRSWDAPSELPAPECS